MIQVSILIFMLFRAKTSPFHPLHFGNYPFLVNHDNYALHPKSIFISNTVNAVILSNFRGSVYLHLPLAVYSISLGDPERAGGLLGSSSERNESKVLKAMHTKCPLQVNQGPNCFSNTQKQYFGVPSKF